jgi:hypothetical protein
MVKADVAREALLFLASSEVLDSGKRRREVCSAKDAVIAILRDMRLDDPRLKPRM